MSYFVVISHFFSTIDWKLVFNITKIIFLILDIGLVVAIIYSAKRAREFYPSFVKYNKIPFLKKNITLKNDSVSLVSEWNLIEQQMNTVSEEGWAILIIEADKLVDEALKRFGFEGDTMLKRIQSLARLNKKMKTLEAFWRAHKIRNHIAHTSGYIISRNDAETYLASYKSFLKELGCL